ncbi:MAG: leucine-rich repeat protein [Lachnospiraceae bacterium]|nr:leucine-rich repeat protein [Lachnospiraceae bacterium]
MRCKTGRRTEERLVAYVLAFILVLSIMPHIDGSLPVTAQAATVGRDGLALDYANVKTGESDYDAFIRIGQEFYNTYIKGKYTSTGALKGGTEKVFTQESVYALEYAMNKDILSDDAVKKLTSGSTKLVDLPTYAERVNVFCTELIDKMPEARRSTNAPNDLYYNSSVGDEEREWAVSGKGVAVPDFDSLTLLGRDLFGCGSALDYLHHYAVMDKYALWSGDYNSDGMLVNSDGNLLLGWVKLPNGRITVQGGYGSAGICQFYNTSGYSMVMSDCRYYLLKDNILLTKNASINFAKDMALTGRAWYEEGEGDDKTILWPIDKYYGVSDHDIEDVVGEQNYIYMNLAESIGFQKMFYTPDISMPVARDKEYERAVSIINSGEGSVTLGSLQDRQLSIGVSEDSDDWYRNHLYFSSSNERVAAVDNKGRVYGISEGDAVITAVAKTSGRSLPVQIRVHVTDSPDIKSKVTIGASTEDALFLSTYAENVLDTLPKHLEEDNEAAVLLVEQPIFTVNGKRNFNPCNVIGESDKLALERWTQTVACGTLPFEEYKRLSDKLHKQGKKLYITLQSWWGDNSEYADVVWDTRYADRMLTAYVNDPKSKEAAAFIDKMFGAYKAYFEKYGASYDKAGVDGICLTDANMVDRLYRINDGHWSDLISAVKASYNGEIKAHFMENSTNVAAYIENSDLFSNVDGVIITVMDTQDYIKGDNPSVKECKKVMQEHIGSLTDTLYERYGKPIDTEWWLTSTVACAGSHADGNVGKGRWQYHNYSDQSTLYTTVDYLQQMIIWQAALELYSEKEYTGIVFSNYHILSWKTWNQNYDVRDGYDCSANIYQKPAAKLLALWSTGVVENNNASDTICKIDSIGGEPLSFDFHTMKKGDEHKLVMADGDMGYTYSSSDTSVLAVDVEGNLTAMDLGRAKLTISAADGSNVKKSFMVYVLPAASAVASEQYDNTLKVLNVLKEKGYRVKTGTFELMYEFATRINEPVFSDDEISEMVDRGLFDYNTGRKYTEFVLGLRAYGNDITLNDLKATGNTVCTCTANDEYIYDYVVKNPYDANLYMDVNFVDVDTGENGDPISEFHYSDGTALYGWNDSSGLGDGGISITAQYFKKNDVSRCEPYASHMIYTGDRFYFVHAWDVDRDNIILSIDDKEVDIPLEEDGGIAESDLKELLEGEFGEAFYTQLLGDLKLGGNGRIFRSIDSTVDEGERWYDLIPLNIGYPTDTILDFECQDIIYDGETTLAPEITKNYSEGAVTFTYQKKGSSAWNTEAPSEIGTYTVRAAAAPNKGYRKTIYEKTARIVKEAEDKPQCIPPSMVNGLKDGQTIKVTWSEVESATRYKVLKKTGTDSGWTTAGYSNGLSFVDYYCCGQEASYRVCARVDGVYSEGSSETAKIKVPHTLTHVAAVTPAIDQNGNIEYYMCSSCGRYFSDAAGTKEISEESVIVPYKEGTEDGLIDDQRADDKPDGTGEEGGQKPSEGTALLPAEVGATVTDVSSGGAASTSTYIVTGKSAGAGDAGEAAYSGESADSTATSVTIPAAITGADGVTYEVTKIADNALKGNKNVKEVTVGDNIVEIGVSAFQKAAKLTTVKLGKKVSVIGKNAFAGCPKLKKVTASGSAMTSIGDGAFNGDKALTSVDFSKNRVKSIGKNAFNGDKKLKTIKINGNALTKVGKNAFKNIKKKAVITIYAKDKKTYNKAVKLIKKSGAKNVKYKFKKKK